MRDRFHSGWHMWCLTAMAAMAAAASTMAAELRVGKEIAESGAAGVTVPVNLAPAPGENVSAVQFDLLYDETAFPVFDAEPGETAQAAGKSVLTSTPAKGCLRIIVTGLNQTVIAEGTLVWVVLDVAEGIPELAYALTVENAVLAAPDSTSVPVTAYGGTVFVGRAAMHSADTNADFMIKLSELLRVIQLFNTGEFHCSPNTEDGYATGPGDRTCPHHDSDYVAPRDWRINLTELLRLIQFFNAGGYRTANTTTEDGFAPGREARWAP
jgi:hypothetical protein